MSGRKILSLFLILYFAAISVSAGTSLAKNFLRQDIYKNSEIYFDVESQKYNNLFYILCQRSPQNMLCTMFREEHYVDNLPSVSRCNVTLKVEYPYTLIGNVIRVLPLSPSKAAILWVGIGERSGPFGFGEINSLKYTLVNIDFCEITETTLRTSRVPSYNYWTPFTFYPDGETIVRSAGFATYDTSCEISFHDYQCGGSDYCKMTIDKSTGNVTSDTDFYYAQGPNIVDIIPKNPQNPREGNFYFDRKGGVIYVFDKFKGLLHFPSNDNLTNNWQKFRYSVGDHFITVCKEIEETKVKCDQIDFNGTIVMQAIFDLEKKNLSPVPHTLRGGGFLLLTTECDTSNCTEETTTNHVYKIDSNKKLNKVLDVEGFSCNLNEFSYWPKFFENKNQGSLCISLLCYTRKKKFPNGIRVWDYTRGYKYVNVHISAPEDLRIKCLKL